MTRSVVLGRMKQGINRLRTKGGADEAALIELLNGFVDQDGNARSRPGLVKTHTLPSGTVGLCSANGALAVFADSPKTVPAGVDCVILRPAATGWGALSNVHFAAPFLGNEHGAALYVVAEFSAGNVDHYWTLTPDAWAANTDYEPGDQVEPPVVNGFMYRATRSTTRNAWAPKATHAAGAAIEPTVSNGFYYVASNVSDGATSSAVEPVWPTTDEATVKEYSVTEPDSPPPPPTTPTPPRDRNPKQLPRDINERYPTLIRNLE